MENTKKSFGQIWSELTTEQAEYLKDYINKQRKDVKEATEKQLRLHIVRQQRELLGFMVEQGTFGIYNELDIDEIINDFELSKT